MAGKRPIVFLGTPAAAVTVLDAVVAAGHEVLLVVSRADARRGRGGSVSPSPVKARAMELGLAVTDRLEDLHALGTPPGAVAVVVAYGRIIPVDVLGLMPMINVHFSLLPRWRGAAPVERAILAGDPETGVCIMQMEEGLDTGGVYASRSTQIDPTESATQLTGRLAEIGAELMCSVLSGDLPAPTPQSGESTYARKITVADALIDWNDERDTTLRRIRATNAHTFLDGRRLRVISAEAADGDAGTALLRSDGTVGTRGGAIRLLRVQPEGRGPMDAADWLRGLKTGFPVRLG